MRTSMWLAAALALSSMLSFAEAKDPAHSEATQTQHVEQGLDVGKGAATFFRAKDLNGMNVWNAQNEKLGSIEDLVINAESGKVSYAILSHGGVLGIGDKLFIVPLHAMKLQRNVQDNNHFLVLDIAKERLENAPSFDKNNWPDFGSREFTTRVDDYFGARTATRVPEREVEVER